MNFPRFLHSRTLKHRSSLHQESALLSRSFCFRPEARLVDAKKQGSPECRAKVDLTKVLFQRKSTPADIIRISKLRKQETTQTDTSEDVANWLKSRAISLKNKRRKVKIVVALPKAKGKHFVTPVIPRELMEVEPDPLVRVWTGPLYLHSSVPKDPSPVESNFLKLGLGQYK